MPPAANRVKPAQRHRRRTEATEVADTVVANSAAAAMEVVLTADNNHTFLGTLVIEDSRLVVTPNTPPSTIAVPYDDRGATMYAVAVIFVYGFSIVLLIASHTYMKRKNNKQEGEDLSTVNRYLEEVPKLREISRKDSFRRLKMSVIPMVSIALGRDISEVTTKPHLLPSVSDCALPARTASRGVPEKRSIAAALAGINASMGIRSVRFEDTSIEPTARATPIGDVSPVLERFRDSRVHSNRRSKADASLPLHPIQTDDSTSVVIDAYVERQAKADAADRTANGAGNSATEEQYARAIRTEYLPPDTSCAATVGASELQKHDIGSYKRLLSTSSGVSTISDYYTDLSAPCSPYSPISTAGTSPPYSPYIPLSSPDISPPFTPLSSPDASPSFSPYSPISSPEAARDSTANRNSRFDFPLEDSCTSGFASDLLSSSASNKPWPSVHLPKPQSSGSHTAGPGTDKIASSRNNSGTQHHSPTAASSSAYLQNYTYIHVPLIGAGKTTAGVVPPPSGTGSRSQYAPHPPPSKGAAQGGTERAAHDIKDQQSQQADEEEPLIPFQITTV